MATLFISYSRKNKEQVYPFAEALRLIRKLLPDLKRVLGADHPGTTNTRKWIQHLEDQP